MIIFLSSLTVILFASWWFFDLKKYDNIPIPLDTTVIDITYTNLNLDKLRSKIDRSFYEEFNYVKILYKTEDLSPKQHRELRELLNQYVEPQFGKEREWGYNRTVDFCIITI